MKCIVLNREYAPAYHAPDLAVQGQIIRLTLEKAELPKSSPLRVIRATFMLPAGRPFFEALRSCKPSELCTNENFLSIKCPPKRSRRWQGHSIEVPNFLLIQQVSRRAIEQFLRLPKPDWAGLLQPVCGIYITWERLCDCLESSLSGSRFSPALIRYANFQEIYAKRTK